jgi:hypothetical protein
MTLLQLDDGKISLCDSDAMCATRMRTQFSDTWPTDRLGHLPSTYLSVRIGILTTCGVKEVHEYFPIQKVWDSDVTGTTSDRDVCGDTDAATRKDIQRHYNNDSLSLSLALGSHHRSITFFDDPSDNDHYYTAHIKAMAPEMTILCGTPICLITGKRQFAASLRLTGITVISPLSPFISGCRALQQH